MLASILLAGAALLPQFRFADAQTSNATCTTDFEWAENSLGQTPCVMAAYLRAACKGNHHIKALPEGYHYNGPTDPMYTEPCWCSSVTYSLYAACQLCQTRIASLFTWGEWHTNCSTTDTANGWFQRPIPAGTAIPAWAFAKRYLDTEVFSSIEAQNYAATNRTEVVSRPTTPSASSPLNPSPSGPSGSNGGNGGNGNNGGNGGSGNNNNNNGDGDEDSDTPVAAIAGGVVGGVVGLAIVGAGLFFLLRKKATTPASSPLMGQSMQQPPPMGQMPYQQQPFMPPPPGPSPGFNTSDTASQRFYNPSDPSTFPGSNTSPPPHQPSPMSYHSGPTMPQPNRYSAHPNVPEL